VDNQDVGHVDRAVAIREAVIANRDTINATRAGGGRMWCCLAALAVPDTMSLRSFTRTTADTVITDAYRNTSLITTLRERWALGPPLTTCDATAPGITPVLTRTTPRPQEDWPDVTPPTGSAVGRDPRRLVAAGDCKTIGVTPIKECGPDD
jgi:hypothetical protein